MAYTPATVQLLSPEGRVLENDSTAPYLEVANALTDEQLLGMHRSMVRTRRFDQEGMNLQRQGKLALWVPSLGQEGAQIGSAVALRPQDHIFPSYREHVVALERGLDPVKLIEFWSGSTHGGWDPAQTGNLHIYTLVLAAQTLHATGFAMGQTLDGLTGTGDPQKDAATIVYFGDGSSSEGDANESLVFAASYQAPLVFFLQNNHWAISVPVVTQSRTPLYLRAAGFGIPSVQVDGNDALVSYAASKLALDSAREGRGPQYIEAVTYRMGAHTSSDDATKYRGSDDVAEWAGRDPIRRFEAFLRGRGVADSFFTELEAEAEDFASDVRTRVLSLQHPPIDRIFDHVYFDEHPVTTAQKQWLIDYEASLGDPA
jgi:2-oxoisovalerate dehydrogenase E1 component alpha subunit